jgi:penicillin-binding protein 2
VWLQLISSSKYRRLARENYVKPIVIEAPRGIIYSKDKKILADNVPAYTIIIDSTCVTTEEYNKIVSLFQKIDSSLTVSYVMKKVPFNIICKIEERKKEFPNVSIEICPLRRYPWDTVFYHVIGYVGAVSKEERKLYPFYRLGSTIGKSGIEKAYEKFLKGKDGTKYVEVNARGEEQEILSYVPPEPGYDVWLNIDAELQLFAYKILPHRSACVAMNPKNGEVILWISKPGVDPNLFPLGIPPDIWNRWTKDSLAPLWDRVKKGKFPPASIFKLITCASALEKGIVSPETRQMNDCTGGILIGNRKYECWETHGSLNLIDAIVYSCDVYFYQLGLQLGVEEITHQAKKIRLGNKTGVDIQGEFAGFIPSKEWYQKRYGKWNWDKGISANLSIGQGELLTTPLQILYFVSGIANKGLSFTPRIVDKIVSSSGETFFSSSPTSFKFPWQLQTIEILRKGMLGVVERTDGTGRLAKVPGIRVAGKTGTAQNPRGETHAWFVAFAPYEDPQICIVVFIEHGGMGGSVAAPIVGKILRKFFGRPV